MVGPRAPPCPSPIGGALSQGRKSGVQGRSQQLMGGRAHALWLPSTIWGTAEEGRAWVELMGCWLAAPSLALSGAPHSPSKPSFPLSFLHGFGGRAVTVAVLAHRRCPPAPSPHSTLLPPGHLCPFGLAASSSQGNHDEKALKKRGGEKVSRTSLCGSFVLLRELRFGG